MYKNKIILLLYNFFMFFFFWIISIKYFIDWLFYLKYRDILWYKIGFRKQKISSHQKEKCVWIHATSFGETLSTKNILKGLKEQSDSVHIIFSTFTSVGYDLAKTFPEIDQLIILPTDTRKNVKDLVKKIKPDLFILTESDYWLNLLTVMKQKNIPTMLIGGRISDRSFNRFKFFSSFSTYLFSHFDKLLLQDCVMKEKFQKLEVNPKNIEVVGNLKVDNLLIKKKKKVLNLSPNRRYITIGSSHEGEEMALLKNLESLPKDVTLIIAPRRPDRFNKVERLLNDLGLYWRKIDEKGSGLERAILVNKLGVLNECYAYSMVAIVGGSFFPSAGGHNLYEPVIQGTRVLYGPYTYNQHSLKNIVEKFEVGAMCTFETVKAQVLNAIKQGRLSQDEIEKIQQETKGVTKKTLNEINFLLKKSRLCYG